REQEEARDNMQLISKMVSGYKVAGIAGKEHEDDILHRETISSFAIRNGLVFLHSLIPAKETKLSVVSLKHPIRWSDFKISTVVMGLFRKEDINLLFRLKIRLCNRGVDPMFNRFPL
ncbi:MAG: PTS sugar transporter subunit IIA, partial [Oscillospiraceae bacterium]|nr:PTS sugar transporter subunit IIA [Oscillospiraceae bacterium]